MDITIWDMDFYYKKSFIPNIDAMQISSFHKQKGDLINFVTEDLHLKLKFDIMYILREKGVTPRPTSKLLDDRRVRVLGSEMVKLDNFFELTDTMAAVRPDYLLYPFKEKDPYYNAHMLKFYNKGKLIKNRQPFLNSRKTYTRTLVTDSDFWEHSDEEIISCLQELLNFKNIAFNSFINLKKILDNQEIRGLFVELDYTKATVFKFRNNFGHTKKHAEIIFSLIDELKEKNPSVFFGRVPFKTVTSDHWDEEKSIENGMKDIIRCLEVIDYAKEKKYAVKFVKTDRKNFESPFWYYLDNMQFWTENLESVSFVEYMLWSLTKRTGLNWYNIINNPMKWSTPNCHFLLSLMKEIPEEIKKYGFRRWGDTFEDKELINWDIVEKYKGKIKETIYGGEDE